MAQHILVSPLYKSYGLVNYGTTSDQTITVSNNGDGTALRVGTLTGITAPFSLVNNQLNGCFINPGDSSTVVARYSPQAGGGISTASLIIPNNDTTYSFAIDGTSAQPDILVTPSPLAVGSTVPNTSVRRTVTVQNVGALMLSMHTVVSSNSQFTLASDNVSLANISAGDSSTVDVVFTPGSSGSQAGVVTFNSSDPDTLAFPLTVTGTGVALSGKSPFRRGWLANQVVKSDTTVQLFTDEKGQIDYCNAFVCNAPGLVKITCADASSSDCQLRVNAGTRYEYSVSRFWSTGTDSSVTIFAIK